MKRRHVTQRGGKGKARPGEAREAPGRNGFRFYYSHPKKGLQPASLGNLQQRSSGGSLGEQRSKSTSFDIKKLDTR